MIRRIPVLLPLLLLLLLTACAEKTEPARRYPMQGEIKALDPNTRSATIAAGKIEGWMDAMTMEYPLKPDAEFQKLHVGDKIEAIAVVADSKYYVTDIKVMPKQ